MGTYLFKRLTYNHQGVNVTTKVYVSKFKEFLKSYDHETWYIELFNDKNCINGNKVRTYWLYKKSLTTETYVNAIISRYECSILAKLQAGRLLLESKTGQYKYVPLEERTFNSAMLPRKMK